MFDEGWLGESEVSRTCWGIVAEIKVSEFELEQALMVSVGIFHFMQCSTRRTVDSVAQYHTVH